jgi:hypothetical protein
VLKTRKDSDCHAPDPRRGAYRFAPDPISEKKKESKTKENTKKNNFFKL